MCLRRSAKARRRQIPRSRGRMDAKRPVSRAGRARCDHQAPRANDRRGAQEPATLRKRSITCDQTETLERSYAKQLGRSPKRRRRGAALAEPQRANRRIRRRSRRDDPPLDRGAHRLEQVKLDRDQAAPHLRAQPRNLDRSPLTSPGAESPVGEGTINQLIANPGWLAKKESAPQLAPRAKVSAEQDPQPVE